MKLDKEANANQQTRRKGMKKGVLIVAVTLLMVSMVAMGCPRPVEVVPPPEQELVVLQGISPDNISPQHTVLAASWWVFSKMVSTLVAFDHNLEPVPYLAESWEVAEDGLTWTFHLRRDVKFHDGTPFNAEAAAWSLNRFIAEAGAAWQLRPVKEVVAVDEYTIEVRTQDIFPALLARLASHYTGFISPTAFEKYKEGWGIRHMVGSGPFKLYEFIPGDRVVLVRNEEYTWGPAFAKNRGPAHLETLVFKVIPEDVTRIMELEVGKGTMTWEVPTVDIARLTAAPHMQVITAPEWAVDFIMFNLADPLFEDVRVRRAIAHAIDVDPILEFILEGFADRAYGPVGPAMTEYYEGVEELAPYYKHNIEKAKRLLAEVGWVPGPDGILVHEETGERFRVEMWLATAPEEHIRAMEVVKEQLRGVGIEIELVTMELGTFWPKIQAHEHRVAYEDIHWSEGAFMAYLIYHRDGFPFRGVGADPRLVELVEALEVTLDTQQRFELLREVERLSAEVMPIIPLWHEHGSWAATADVGGLDLVAEHPWWSSILFCLELYIRD
jgi:peptide/nickel transport system substrate-binding protein